MQHKTISYYSQSRPEMLDFVPQAAVRILDVGCGAGSFGLVLKERFPDAELFGIECNSEAAKEAARIYDHVWVGDVCEILSQQRDVDFDLIIFNDILEHIVNPWLCLTLTKELILPNGRVVASIPNMRFWPVLSDLIFQGNWSYRDAGVMDITHLRFFTKKSIRRLFEESGYNVHEMSGINKTWKISMRWRILNTMFLGRFNDCLFPQFAVVATPVF